MIYRRTFDAGGEDSLAKLARWIRPGSRVLELGAAAGYFTEHLRSRGCTVDIVEIDPAAAAEAARHARRAVVADLEGDTWLAELGETRYDAIVCADVLEHLRDGARLMARLRPLLAEGGELLLSVPNVAHNAVIANLIADRFDYGAEGLLDPTHLRLYTWRSLAALLHGAGYAVSAWDATTLAMFDTEFHVRGEALAPALRDALASRGRGLVYQWLVRAAPGDRDAQAEPAALQRTESVPVRLLSGADAGALSLDGALAAALPVGGAPVELEWRLPRPAGALRLLLADRVGVIRVLDCRLHAGGEVLWSLGSANGDIDCSASATRIDGTNFALTEPDAWIAPVLAPASARRADRLTATLAWPLNIGEAGAFAVFAALARALEETRSRAQQHSDNLQAALDAALDARERQRVDGLRLLSETRSQLESSRAAFAHRDAEAGKLEQEVAALRAEQPRLEAALAAQERIIAYRQSARWWLRLPLLRIKLLWRRLTGG